MGAFAVLVCFVKVSLLLVSLLADRTASKADWCKNIHAVAVRLRGKSGFGMQQLSGSLGICSVLSLHTSPVDEVFEGRDLRGRLIQNKLNFLACQNLDKEHRLLCPATCTFLCSLHSSVTKGGLRH